MVIMVSHQRLLGAVSVAVLLLHLLSSGVVTAHLEFEEEEEEIPEVLTCHGGPILTGEIQLGLMWFGTFTPVQKDTIHRFIAALGAPPCKEPSVAKWWSVVESFQLDPAQLKCNAPPPPIKVTVVNEATDESYSIGKIVTIDYIPNMMGSVACGNKNMVVAIFTAKDVTVQGLCMGLCTMHGQVNNQTYFVVGDPETECPDACGWPYVECVDHPGTQLLKPFHGEWTADALLMHFAAGLASTVTNPANTGFYGGHPMNPQEAGTVCETRFGSGADEGNPGKVEIDPATCGAFNAYGATEADKFLLPGLYSPTTQDCWSLM